MAVEGIDRREFILKTALGLITASLGASTVRSASAEIGKSSKIVYRTLGNTKLQIPLVSFGVMNSDSPDLIRKALDMGVKHLDTAHVYLRGNSEKVIGQILEERKCRDQVFGFTDCFADQFWPEAKGEFEDLDLEQLGEQKMAEFMDKYENTENNNKGYERIHSL